MGTEARLLSRLTQSLKRRIEPVRISFPMFSGWECRTAMLLVLCLSVVCYFCGRTVSAATYRTANFNVHADNTNFARQVGDAAERYRDELAMLWLGQTIPQWGNPCEVNVVVGPRTGSAGEVAFTFYNGEVYDWKMLVQGSEQGILESVLPHEVTHAIIASYLRSPAPRWLDEGMATSVEAKGERDQYRSRLIEFLQTGHGIAFNEMVEMKEYPTDQTPFYSQAFSVCEYLILVGGRRRLLEFARVGNESNDWNNALKEFYECESLGSLQTEWLEWVKRWNESVDKTTLPVTRKMRDFDVMSSREAMLAHNERLTIPGNPAYNVEVTTPNARQGRQAFTPDERRQGGFFGSLRDITDLGKMRTAPNDAAVRAQVNEQRSEPRGSFNGLPMYGKTISPFGKAKKVEPPVVTDAQNEAFDELDRRDNASNEAPIYHNEVYASVNNASLSTDTSGNFFSNGAGSARANSGLVEPSTTTAGPAYYRPAERSSYSDTTTKRF